MKGGWIDVNKGDNINWKYRRRFVTRGFGTGDGVGFFFSVAPPQAALRVIIIDGATRDQVEDKVIMVIDVARAFCEAPARRTICEELLDQQTYEGDEVGLLVQSLHGTRDARSKYNPSSYYLEKVGTKAMVHANDSISSVSRKSLRWFRQVMESRLEISTAAVGDG